MDHLLRGECEGYALAAGAIVPCPGCAQHYLSTVDDYSTAAAYEAVGRAWGGGEFPCSDRSDVMRTMALVLAAAKPYCSACGARAFDPGQARTSRAPLRAAA